MEIKNCTDLLRSFGLMFIKQINDCLIENAIKGYGGKNVYFSIFREPSQILPLSDFTAI